MSTATKQAMYKRITNHGEQLKSIFNLDNSVDAVKLCKSLRRLEAKAHRATTNLCNTNTLHLQELNRYTGYDVEQTSEEEQDAFFEKIRKAVIKILNLKPSGNMCPDDCYPVIINYDPRGYALKISDAYIREYGIKIYQDFGGYGILAPDLTN